MKRYKHPAIRLALIPGLIEALYDAGVATGEFVLCVRLCAAMQLFVFSFLYSDCVAPAIFGMPFTLALTMGFIMKAVGPGLVVPAMFKLQKLGWGKDQGVLPGESLS